MSAFRAALVLALALAGCVAPDARPAFRAGVVIDDRGIVVPLPPPSFFDSPIQEVDVQGSIIGDDPIADVTVTIASTMPITKLARE